MSLPLAVAHTGEHANALAYRHGTPAPERGVDVLADRIAMYVDSFVPQGHVRCLDIGGGDMTLAEAVERRKSRTDWRCFDVHRLPSELGDDALRRKYDSLDGGTIRYADGEFDVAVLCDVLQAAPVDAARLLAEAGRVARHVLVKDRFAHGPCAFTTRSRLVDLVDSRGGRYFTREGFVRVVTEQGLRITALDCELDLAAHSGSRMRRKPGWHFLAALTR